MTTAPLPQGVFDAIRNWAWDEFTFGGWFPTSEITDYIRNELGYTASTPGQYTARFLARGAAQRDFETRLKGREWRWIAHPKAGEGV